MTPSLDIYCCNVKTKKLLRRVTESSKENNRDLNGQECPSKASIGAVIMLPPN
jgi:hypothetical protein